MKFPISDRYLGPDDTDVHLAGGVWIGMGCVWGASYMVTVYTSINLFTNSFIKQHW